MNLYLVSRPQAKVDYDEYGSFVIAEVSPEEALTYHPAGGKLTEEDKRDQYSWPLAELTVELIGTGDHPAGRIILASYNAG